MDLFGKALRTYHQGKTDAQIIITRDGGWQDAHSPGLYFTPEPSELEEIAALAGWTVARLAPQDAFYWAVLERD